jgi:hypothetical protein
MVPVFYSIFVLDLKLIKWEKEPENVPTKNDFDLDSDAAWDV